MVDLTLPGARSCCAFDINNRGVVVGHILADDGAVHGALWPKALTRLPADGTLR